MPFFYKYKKARFQLCILLRGFLTLDRTCFFLSLGESTTTQTTVASAFTSAELSYRTAPETFETPTTTTTVDTTTTTTTAATTTDPRATTELTHDLTTGSTQSSGTMSAYLTSHSTETTY